MGIFELPIPYGVLVAATEECLPGYAGDGWVDFEKIHETPESTKYQLNQYQLGNLGNLTIRKLRNDLSEVYFSGPPSAASQRRKHTQEERAEIDSASNKDELVNSILAVNEKINQESNDLYNRRKDHLGDVITAFLDRLSRENIWPEEQSNIDEQATREDWLKVKFEMLKPETQDRYREVWEIMCEMDSEFKEDALDKKTKNPKPQMGDYRDRIINSKVEVGTSERTLSEIRKYGKAGLLN